MLFRSSDKKHQNESKGGEELTLGKGDGAYVFCRKQWEFIEVEHVGDRVADILVFDLGQLLFLSPLLS